ncbi:MAG TPA: HAD-IB family hydrolase [Candidatus Dormibacteraeota bacterium]|nr:HAD-IB family hydrolase [Candidatus Dormibacteraeota bacterium]
MAAPGGAATAEGPGIALFDLDGTLTRHDTLWAYVHGFLHRHPWRAPGAVRVLPELLRFAAGRADHGSVKSAFIQGTLRGCTRAELSAWTGRFVPRLIAHGLWRDALACLDAHRARGDRLVLMSASVDLYVPAIGSALAFAEVLCTPLRWNGERLEGSLAGPNLRGAAKARALRELRERHPGLSITAYGNAESDLGHLCLADRGVLVNGSRHARPSAARLGLTCERWR